MSRIGSTFIPIPAASHHRSKELCRSLCLSKFFIIFSLMQSFLMRCFRLCL